MRPPKVQTPAERGRAMIADLLHRGGEATAMAAAAAEGLMDPDEVRLLCEHLSRDLVAAPSPLAP